ncbi:MAG: pilus assembly protein TadG-related protein [Phycisphaerae bacterium]
MYPRAHAETRRRAVAAAQVAILLPVLVGFAAMTIDVGVLYNTKADLQRTADAAALAAASVVANTEVDVDPRPSALATAIDYVELNQVMNHEVTVDADADVVFGRARYNASTNAYNFVPMEYPPDAVRVTVRQTEDSPNGKATLLFARIFGKAATNVSATAVAMVVDTCFEEADCNADVTEDTTLLCHHGNVENDSHNGGDSDSESGGHGDSADSDAGNTIEVSTEAVPIYLSEGDTLGACDPCEAGDSDDSDDSQGEYGPPDSTDSDDSDSGDSDGSHNGDSDDSDDSQGEYGPPDSDDSDDSDSGDSDGSHSGDSDDSDDSEGGFSDDSDDSDEVVGGVEICHYPPGNPANAHTITIAPAAVQAHFDQHGDYYGECDPEDPPEEDPGSECLVEATIMLIE